MLRLRIELPDQPGSLARLTGTLAAFRGDIAQVTVMHRVDGVAVDDIFMSLTAPDQVGSILDAVSRLPRTCVLGSRASSTPNETDAHLDLVAYLFAVPHRGLEAFVDMLPAVVDGDWAAVSTTDGTLSYRSAEPADADDEIIRLPITDGLVLEIGRSRGLPWHPLEQRRVASVLELAAQLVKHCGGTIGFPMADITAWLVNSPDLAVTS
jgi:hypothetical protein